MQHKSDINTPMFYSVVEPVYFSCLLLPSVEVGGQTTTTSNEKQQFVGRLRSTVTTLSRSDFLKHGCTLGCPKILTFLKSSPARSFSQLGNRHTLCIRLGIGIACVGPSGRQTLPTINKRFASLRLLVIHC